MLFSFHVIIVTLQFILCFMFGLVSRFCECIFEVVDWLKILIAFIITLPLYVAIGIVRVVERYWIGRREKAYSFSRVTAYG